MTGMNILAASALTLREEFDRAFATLPSQTDSGARQLLAIRAGGRAYALRLDEIRGLQVDRRVQSLPSHLPELLGLTGVRGQAVPVFDLAALLGQPPQRAPRWLGLAAGRHNAAFAFEQFEAQVAVRQEDFLDGAVRIGDTLCALVSLPALVDDLERRCQRLRSIKP